MAANPRHPERSFDAQSHHLIPCAAVAAIPVFTHRWRLKKRHPERFGEPCRIVPKPGAKYRGGGRWYEVVVWEFRDGSRIDDVRTAARPRRYSTVFIRGGRGHEFGT